MGGFANGQGIRCDLLSKTRGDGNADDGKKREQEPEKVIRDLGVQCSWQIGQMPV